MIEGLNRRLDAARAGVAALAVACTVLVYSFRGTSFFHVKEGVLALCVAALAALALAQRINLGAAFRVYSPLLFLLVWASLIPMARPSLTIWPNTPNELARCAVAGLFALLTFDLLADRRSREWVLDAVVISGAAAAMLGVLQYAGFLTTLFPSFGGTAERMYSVFGNSGLLGGYLALAVALGFAQLVSEDRLVITRTALVVVMFAGLLLSGSRSAWLAAAMGCGMAFAVRGSNRRRALPALGACAIALMAVFAAAPHVTLERAGRTFAADDAGTRLRLWFWAGTLDMIRAHPITGVGLGTFPYHSPRHFANVLWSEGGGTYTHNTLHTEHAHCDPLELLAETGVVGLALAVAMIARLLVCRGPEWPGLAALLAFSVFHFPFHSAPHAAAGAVLAGSLLGRRHEIQLKSPEGTAAGAMDVSSDLERQAARWQASLLRWGVAAVSAALAVYVVSAVCLPSARLKLAEQVHLGGGDPQSAYEAAVDHPFAPAIAHERFGVWLLESRRYEEAQTQFQTALSASDRGSTYVGLGAAYYGMGNREKAALALDEALFRWPSYEDGWRLRLRCARPDEVPELLEKARRWLPSMVVDSFVATGAS